MSNPLGIAALALLLTACARSDGPDGFYAGPVTPDQPSPSCTPSRGTLQLRREVATFVPDEGTWVLQGPLGADGAIWADRSQVGANKQVHDTTFEGRRTGDTVAGTYTTPKCHFKVALTRR